MTSSLPLESTVRGPPTPEKLQGICSHSKNHLAFQAILLVILLQTKVKRKYPDSGTSLAVHGLGLHAPAAGEAGLIPGRGTKRLPAARTINVCLPTLAPHLPDGPGGPVCTYQSFAALSKVFL